MGDRFVSVKSTPLLLAVSGSVAGCLRVIARPTISTFVAWADANGQVCENEVPDARADLRRYECQQR